MADRPGQSPEALKPFPVTAEEAETAHGCNLGHIFFTTYFWQVTDLIL